MLLGMPLGLGVPEILLILVIFLVFFGAAKLPQAGQALGLGIKNFKKAMSGEEDIDVTPKKKKQEALEDGDDEDEKPAAKAESKTS